jgi:protein-S-isoprenylcysteine O-methyltransferase Ste14
VNTITMASRNLTASILLSSAAWLSHVRAARGYETAVRVLGCSWFLILALVAAVKVFVLTEATGLGAAGWPAILSGTCLLLFYLTLCWLILHRPPPASRTTGILPSLIAFVGTYLPWTAVLFESGAVSATQNFASALLLLIGSVSMMVVIFHLGLSFSIVPQARKLVRTGPYAVVRHPLYLVEEVALLGTVLQVLSPLTLALFIAHGVLQIRRMFYEEAILRRTFPDFDVYARSTPRLIPYVW